MLATLSITGRLAVGLAVAGLALSGPVAPEAVRSLGHADPEVVLPAAATLLHVAVSAWILGVVALVGSTGGARLARHVAPRWVLRTLMVGAIGTATLTPAHADGPSGAVLDGLRLPDRPTTGAVAVPGPAADPGPTAAVTVSAGDSLWSIAARHLPPGTSADRVAAATVRWHELNRGVIGDDPDLIHPGQRLVTPQENA